MYYVHMSVAPDIELTLEEEESDYLNASVEVVLDPEAKNFVKEVVNRILLFSEEMAGEPFYPYQREFAYRLAESLMINDGEELTALWSRQCLDGDTIVFRRDGTAVRLRDHENAVSTGIKATKRYVIDNGSEVIATDNHPIMTPDGWVPAGTLKVGDLVATAAKVNKPRTYSILKKGRAYKIGKVLRNTRPELNGVFRNHISSGIPFRYRDINLDRSFCTDVFNWSDDDVVSFVRGYFPEVTLLDDLPCQLTLMVGDKVNARYWQALFLRFGIGVRVSSGDFPNILTINTDSLLRFKQIFTDCVDADSLELKYDHIELDNELITYSRVELIEDAGEREVFDAIYVGKDWFIAQGLQVHNSGKTDTTAKVTAGCMVLFPKLAKIYPDWFGKFKKGLWVGVFAPVDEQAETLFQRIVGFLTSDTAAELMLDPEIDDKVTGRGKTITLKSGSLARQQTANPRAKIESKTYHLVIIDESQLVEEFVVSKSISPMLASTNGTIVKTGTANRYKGNFYRAINRNKRRQTNRGARRNHFEFDWRYCAESNPNYKRYVIKEMGRIGQDSDEFQLSYELKWLLDRGMFVTESTLEGLGDKSMERVKYYTKTPCVVGVDPARTVDSTVVTVCYVDWDRPDEFGYYHHRVLNWLELSGENWEEQYYQIVDFLSNYNVWAVAVDAQGIGDVVADRLARLMPNVNVVAVPSTVPEQSKRWKHLTELMGRGLVVFPWHAKTRRLRVWQRFQQQMIDLEKHYSGPHLKAEAPDEADAHDDYPDSLALACSLTIDTTLPEAEMVDNVLYR